METTLVTPDHHKMLELSNVCERCNCFKLNVDLPHLASRCRICIFCLHADIMENAAYQLDLDRDSTSLVGDFY